MFKNVSIFSISGPLNFDGLAALRFAPCTASQEKSNGWSPVLAGSEDLHVVVNNQHLLRFTHESKTVPASEVRKRVDQLVAHIESTEGRKPGRKELREMREDVAHALLSQAFPRTSSHLVWIDPSNGRLHIECSVQSRADTIITGLIQSVPDITVAPLDDGHGFRKLFGQVVREENDTGLDCGKFIELQSLSDLKATVRIKGQSVNTEEVWAHVSQGMEITKLGVSKDDQVSLVLSDGFRYTNLNLLDFKEDEHEEENTFGAEFVIVSAAINSVTQTIQNYLAF